MYEHRFIVDLDDPEDVARKREYAGAQVTEINAKLSLMKSLMEEREKWQARRDFLTSQMPAAEEPQPETKTEPEPGSASRPNHVEMARRLDGPREEATDAPQGLNSGVGDLVVPVVDNAGGPIRSLRVHEILAQAGHPVSPTMVSNALNYAARAGKLKKVAGMRGFYAPLVWEDSPGINFAVLEEDGS